MAKAMTTKSVLISLLLIFVAVLVGATDILIGEYESSSVFFVLMLLAIISGFWMNGSQSLYCVGFLFFMSWFVFVLARPMIGILSGDESVFHVTFGREYWLSRNEISSTLSFWSMSGLSFFAGYFLLGKRDESFYVEKIVYGADKKLKILRALLAISFFIIPVIFITKISAFLSGGYGALYQGQSEYQFNFTRILDFIIPLILSIYITADQDKKYSRMVFIVIFSYVLSSLVVGQRAAFGVWLLVFFWVKYGVHKNKAPLLIWGGGVIAFIFIAQIFEAYRSNLQFNFDFINKFLINQGMTFFLPYFYNNIDEPSLYTKLFSIFPGGSLAQSFGLVTSDASNISRYLSSSLSMTHFENGFGIGGSFFIEIYSLSNNIYIHSILIFCIGLIISKAENLSKHDNRFLFWFAMLMPSLMLISRGSIYTLSSQLIYSVCIFSFFSFIMLLLRGKLWRRW
ncbi:TPA: O-antigen polysaccharide polymerase Wzy [Aeromonas dhakensis]|nr:O-antigen polysaccharide polymerase Wzy [Aeromonas dhakensis]